MGSVLDLPSCGRRHECRATSDCKLENLEGLFPVLRLDEFGNGTEEIGVDSLRRLRHVHVMEQAMNDRQH